MSLLSNKTLTRRSVVAGAAALVGSSVFGLYGCDDDSGEEPVDEPGTGTDGEDWLSQDPQEATLFLFDTVFTIKAYCSKELMDEVEERCNYFEQHFSRTVDGSDVSLINEAGGRPVEVAQETADIIAKSLTYSEMSDGLFDITIGTVSTLWDFKEGVKPEDSAIKAALPHIDYKKVKVEGNTVTLEDPEAKIDLGAVAKGYLSDDLAKIFEEGGCKSAIINLGGNVYALGTKPDGSQWNVGIQDPNGEAQDVIASIPVTNRSVITSGLYERHFEKDGVDYYHILDPKTGYPVETDLKSSSVLTDVGIDGDAYSTMMFILGHDKALEFLNSHDGVEGILVNGSDEISQSQGNVFTIL